ncbi:hypothetical protein [Amycolatopsis sp. WAC 04182]|uniref:hypothetical protein n=1 Tax=Amycolatopsis sp. WAC 04182 TaxID=2203198 RepID=UPI0013152374|nr:hypothetical protein [Amycolatopsis sp. WAC 04182]
MAAPGWTFGLTSFRFVFSLVKAVFVLDNSICSAVDYHMVMEPQGYPAFGEPA